MSVNHSLVEVVYAEDTVKLAKIAMYSQVTLPLLLIESLSVHTYSPMKCYLQPNEVGIKIWA